jgi:hypothetical protein
MGVERIHACPNHCILYHGDTFKDLKKCPVCSASRYKNNAGYYGDDNHGPTDMNKRNTAKNSVASVEPDDATLGIPEKQSRIPAMVMWYLLVSDRLRRFFSNPKDAKLMRWWDSYKHTKGDGKLRHPADARQWKEFDEKYYLEFGNYPRNVRFVLSTDGMNPFGERSSTDSTWLVILMMYNLPIWLCQKRKYILLSVLIEGPKHSGFDIDVFLEPLMQEMETLWKEGINIFDGCARQHFNLRAIIFVTIHDYQALFVLSGQMKGRTGCTVCLDGNVSSFLEGS